MIEALFQADKACLDYIQTLRAETPDALMAFVTFLGDAGLLWIVWAGVLCLFPKSRKTGLLMLAALAVTFVVSTLGLKNLFERPRPCVSFPKEMFYACPAGFSFPSGHTVSSFAASGVLFFRREKGRIAALIAACLIAFSRMYLYVHFPSDVLAGALLGGGAAYLVVARGAVRKKAEPKLRL